MHWVYPESFDVIVVGAGHAGCEAAHASAKMGAKTLLLTMNLDTVAKMSCNPAVGGTAKGHIVREIDALGGIMGKVTDEAGIQFRMLNASKGPAVWSPRAQTDKHIYSTAMKRRLEGVDNLFLKQGTIVDVLVKESRVVGISTLEGIDYHGKTVILSSGTFLRGRIHIGTTKLEGGRAGDKPSIGLSTCLEKLGFSLGRLKTGTPPRIHRRSIDLSCMQEQQGEEGVRFSFDPPDVPLLPQLPCYIAYTNEATKKIIQDNLHLSPMYSGEIQCVGPRYCPAIEDKVVRFAEKERHQIFMEPEGIHTAEIYVNGLSSSLPFDIQLKALRTIEGCAHAEILRPAYAIEYDYATSGQLTAALETKRIEGLFFAGQINGTTGYEEAAGQGWIAGVNAALKVQGKAPFMLKRSESYIAVMIDDLISKDLEEPYRMFTSRAEYRLLLRQDNADLRLRKYGYALGLVDAERNQCVEEKRHSIREITHTLRSLHKQVEGKSTTLAQLLMRPEWSYAKLLEAYPNCVPHIASDVQFQVEVELKYAGYIQRQEREVEKLATIEEVHIPAHIDYRKILGLGTEAIENLERLRPHNLGQAARLSGVSPADITVLRVALTAERRS